MKKTKKVIQKILIILSIMGLNLLGFINAVYATNLNTAHIYSIGDCGSLLTYKGIVVKTNYVEYKKGEMNYPAYCMDKTKQGAEGEGYTVSIENAIQDVGLWKRIIHGYPYQSISELGVANKEEAFTATKQAIYCYIHQNNPEDYGAIGEAGQRTLNAMKQIITNAENSKETKVSSTITINKKSKEWKQDEKEEQYAYKIYSVTAGSNIKNYKIMLNAQDQEVGGLKIVDRNNQEKQEFKPNEEFKVLVPIKNMTETKSFGLKVEAQISTKPVLYGKAPDSSQQDYALTASVYEDGTGSCTDTYNRNETKLIIQKIDEATKQILADVEFELLDKEQNVLFQNLKTNEKGTITIENMLPGEYYLRETKAKDGYTLNNDVIGIKLAWNEELTVTINNNKELKEPKVEITKNQTEVKRLPVTGN